MINATIKIIKGKEKTNITASISHTEDGGFKNYNFTGKLVSLEGYVTKDGRTENAAGEKYDDALVSIDCPTTALIFNEDQGNAIYDRCAEIFEERAAIGDSNPAVDLVLTVKTVRPKETNILLVNVKQAYVDADTQIVDNSATVDDVLTKLKANSASNQNNQVSAARAGLSRLVKKVAKTYL